MKFSILRLLIVVSLVSAWLALVRLWALSMQGHPDPASPAVAWILGFVMAPVSIILVTCVMYVAVMLCALVVVSVWEVAGGIESMLRPAPKDDKEQ